MGAAFDVPKTARDTATANTTRCMASSSDRTKDTSEVSVKRDKLDRFTAEESCSFMP